MNSRPPDDKKINQVPELFLTRLSEKNGEALQKPPASPEQKYGHSVHVVRKNETLSEIGSTNQYGAPHTGGLVQVAGNERFLPQADARAQPGDSQSTQRIRPGERIAVPGSSNAAYMLVHDGDTLSKIARDAGVSVQSLEAMNPSLKGAKIHKGDVLQVGYVTTPIKKHEADSSESTVISGGVLDIAGSLKVSAKSPSLEKGEVRRDDGVSRPIEVFSHATDHTFYRDGKGIVREREASAGGSQRLTTIEVEPPPVQSVRGIVSRTDGVLRPGGETTPVNRVDHRGVVHAHPAGPSGISSRAPHLQKFQMGDMSPPPPLGPIVAANAPTALGVGVVTAGVFSGSVAAPTVVTVGGLSCTYGVLSSPALLKADVPALAKDCVKSAVVGLGVAGLVIARKGLGPELTPKNEMLLRGGSWAVGTAGAQFASNGELTDPATIVANGAGGAIATKVAPRAIEAGKLIYEATGSRIAQVLKTAEVYVAGELFPISTSGMTKHIAAENETRKMAGVVTPRSNEPER